MQHGLSGTDTSRLSNSAAADVSKYILTFRIVFRESRVVANGWGSSGGQY
jgi:hypothetical protein